MINILVSGVAVLAFSVSAFAFDLESTLKDSLKNGLPGQASTASAPSTSSSAGALGQLKTTDINAGIKEALTRGSGLAVAQLGKPDGFLGNAALRIPLPPALQKAEQLMRTMGMSKEADDLVLAMNRAAEAAVPEAKTLLVKAVSEMTLEDAKGILSGGNTAATEFFRRKTETSLTSRFGPIVKGATDRAGLARHYDNYAGAAARLGVLDKNQATLEQYVTQQALDRLYRVIGEQESALRANPAQATSALLQKVFGAVGH